MWCRSKPNALVATIDFSGVTEPGSYELPISVETPEGVWRSDGKPNNGNGRDRTL